MRGMREVEVTPTAADRFEAIIGGVDVPDGATEEALAGGISQLGELGDPVAADDGFEPVGSSGGDLDFAHAAHLVLTAAQLLRLGHKAVRRPARRWRGACLLYTSPSP